MLKHVLDGGMGQELLRRSTGRVRIPEGAWSAGFLLCSEGRRLVQDLHQEYLQAGATIITSNTYSCTADVAAAVGRPLAAMIGDACRTAQAAIDAEDANQKKSRGLLAGSLPSLCASTGSEMSAQYTELAGLLHEHGADILLCESMSCVAEAHAAATAAAATGLPVWVAVEARGGGTLVSGEALTATAHELSSVVGMQALLLNSCTIEHATESVAELVTVSSLRGWLCGIYADNARALSPEAQPQESPMLDPGRMPLASSEEFGQLGLRWARQGVGVVGGCCGFVPRDITALVNAVQREHECKLGC